MFMPPSVCDLTKSSFKLGMKCPTKLFYNNNKTTYGDSSADDPFLMALAEGAPAKYLIYSIKPKM